MAPATLMGHATDGEEERFRKMRALSLPDMTELSDIVALDDVIHDDEERDDGDSSSPLQTHPVRLFSIGLQRSMSMPKQQAKPETEEEEKEEEENDDFYFPDDESIQSDAAQDSFLPKFYSNETLAGVIPPAGKKMIGSPVMNGKRRKSSERRMQGKCESEEEASDTEKESSRASCREAPANKAAQQEAALSNLSAFFGGESDEADAGTSPRSVSMFSADKKSQSALKARSKSLPSCSETTGPNKHKEEAKSHSPPRRSIFGKTYTEPPSPSSSDFEFKMLSKSDRGTSMPATLPSAKLPRKPSLKKVSSFVGNSKGEKDSSSEMKPSVSFSNLQIREYDLTLGDHPSCSYGPPVSLGWDYRDAAVVPLEKYEKARSNKFPRRKSSQLVLSYNVRKYLLLKTAGYTKAELREAMKEVERIKHERKMTDMMAPLEPLDEVMEGVINHVKGMFQKK